jgi:hypothetical protein
MSYLPVLAGAFFLLPAVLIAFLTLGLEAGSGFAGAVFLEGCGNPKLLDAL